MIRTFLPVILLFWYTTCVQSQPERTWHWDFGFGLSLDFSSGIPVQVSGSQQFTFEGCASISDATGQKLWYTNGGGRDPIQSGQPTGKIWDRNNNVVYDMSYTEGGGFSSAQSAVFVTKPGAPDHYYLFTMEEAEFYIGGDVPGQPAGRGLSYFELDAMLNGGLGEVVDYQETIYGPTYEGLCAVQHSNGQDWWIVVTRSDYLGFAIIPVTAQGVGDPVEVDSPPLIYGPIKASPDGKWLTTNSTTVRYLWPFDVANGQIGSPVELPLFGSQVEFSPNSRWLYVWENLPSTQVSRYDLESPDPASSKTFLGAIPSTQGDGQLLGFIPYPQLGPDGKIYFATFYLNPMGQSTPYLSAIACTNTGGYLTPNLLEMGNTSGSSLNFLGLPNFPAAWLANLASDSIPVSLGPDTTLCPGDTLILSVSEPQATFLWSTGDTTANLTVSGPGTYAITVSTPCGIGIDTIIVSVVDVQANAGVDTTICAGEQVLLGSEGTGSATWSPAEGLDNAFSPMPLAMPDSTTMYTVTVTQAGCQAFDTVTITVLALPMTTITPQDTTVGPGSPVLVNVTGGTVANWDPANVVACLTCTETEVTVFETTTLIAEVVGPNGCVVYDTTLIRVDPEICVPKLPNVFTPNGDQTNDRFGPARWDAPYRLQVWSRWGKLVYDNGGNGLPWDGMQDGKDMPSDIYAWMFTADVCGEQKTLRGDITLVR